jgi:peptide chain release factor 2
VVTTLDALTSGLLDANDLFELAVEEDDAATISSVVSDLEDFEREVAGLRTGQR